LVEAAGVTSSTPNPILDLTLSLAIYRIHKKLGEEKTVRELLIEKVRLGSSVMMDWYEY
jgi:hypothetical protein